MFCDMFCDNCDRLFLWLDRWLLIVQFSLFSLFGVVILSSQRRYWKCFFASSGCPRRSNLHRSLLGLMVLHTSGCLFWFPHTLQRLSGPRWIQRCPAGLWKVEPSGIGELIETPVQQRPHWSQS